MSNLLEIRNATRRYGDITAINDFSLDLAEGNITALVGPDGAGKTTLMRLICNLIDLHGGEILIDGHSISDKFDSIKPELGYMPQVFSLYPDLSVEENLRFYAGIFDVYGAEFNERAEKLYGFSNLKPFRGRRAQALSGGMKQKLALSCALMHEPRFLLLDEPTTGVDPLSRRQFWEILLSLRDEGVTILVSTPYMDEVARADRACFIFGGEKLAEGTPEELRRIFEGRLYYLDAEPSSSLVRNLSNIDGIKARRFGAGMHLSLGVDDAIERHQGELERLGVDMKAISTIEPDLEDCFIQLMEQAS